MRRTLEQIGPQESGRREPSAESLGLADQLLERFDNGRLDLRSLSAPTDRKDGGPDLLLDLVKLMPGSTWKTLEKAAGGDIAAIALPDALRADPKGAVELEGLKSLASLKSLSVAVTTGSQVIDLTGLPPHCSSVTLRADGDGAVRFRAHAKVSIKVVDASDRPLPESRIERQPADSTRPDALRPSTVAFSIDDILDRQGVKADTPSGRKTDAQPSPRSSVSSASSGIASPSGTPQSTPRNSVSGSATTPSSSSVRRDSGTESVAPEAGFALHSFWNDYQQLKNDHPLYQKVLDYVQKEFSSENFEYLEDTARFLQNPDKASFDAILSTYVGSAAPKSVNLPSASTTKLLEVGRAESFDPKKALHAIQQSSKDIWSMVKVDTLKRAYSEIGVDGPRAGVARAKAPPAEAQRSETPPAPARPSGVFGRLKAWFNGLRAAG